jgi:aryl-alcohol dehydrogenase-like predicted oxidoreductase
MISRQPFGRTNHDSSRLIFGGWALSEATQVEADRVLEILLENGVNHIDTARMYRKSTILTPRACTESQRNASDPGWMCIGTSSL